MPLPLSPACQVVLYCGVEHQRCHFATHKSVCKEIKKSRELMEKEAYEIRNATEDFATPANAFETDVGHFWGILGTRPYMRAKLQMIRALSTIPCRLAIEAALTESLDCLRLCRGDNIGIRSIVPTYHLLLGQYQEAYDFIKWWATTGQEGDYNYGDTDLPYLDVHGADMTEELPDIRYEVFFMSSLAYIKMMLAKGVQESTNAYKLADKASLPAVVSDSLGGFLAPKGLGKNLQELKQLHTKLTRQLHEAVRETHSQNKHFWGAMLDPTPVIQMPDPNYYSHDDVNQVKIWIEQSAMLWENHKEDIRELRRQTA
eukprot:jgi/Phyca11/533490/estExt2_fgenesh1_pg.C_PHYCAscaffold_140070